MKKTKFMRAALLLLVLTLITSCFVGGTFAKYTTKAEGSDSARVAKWGFQPTSITMTDLFKTAYGTTVKAGDKPQTDVIAPGTKGEATFGFTYGGAEGITAPEVTYTFEVSTTGSKCADDIQNNTNIKWSLDGQPARADGKTDGSWDALIAAIEALDGNKTDNTYGPNTLPAAFATGGANEHTVGWEWIFETANGDGQAAAQDATDTRLGNKATLDEVKLVITITATQID